MRKNLLFCLPAFSGIQWAAFFTLKAEAWKIRGIFSLNQNNPIAKILKGFRSDTALYSGIIYFKKSSLTIQVNKPFPSPSKNIVTQFKNEKFSYVENVAKSSQNLKLYNCIQYMFGDLNKSKNALSQPGIRRFLGVILVGQIFVEIPLDGIKMLPNKNEIMLLLEQKILRINNFKSSSDTFHSQQNNAKLCFYSLINKVENDKCIDLKKANNVLNKNEICVLKLCDIVVKDIKMNGKFIKLSLQVYDGRLIMVDIYDRISTMFDIYDKILIMFDVKSFDNILASGQQRVTILSTYDSEKNFNYIEGVQTNDTCAPFSSNYDYNNTIRRSNVQIKELPTLREQDYKNNQTSSNQVIRDLRDQNNSLGGEIKAAGRINFPPNFYGSELKKEPNEKNEQDKPFACDLKNKENEDSTDRKKSLYCYLYPLLFLFCLTAIIYLFKSRKKIKRLWFY